MADRPQASLSLDLDNRWAYLRAAGRQDWADRDSYLPMAVTRITDMLVELNLPLTVFIVGRDLASSKDRDAIQDFDRLERWEPANHSLNHLPWMHTMDSSEIEEEIGITEERIIDVLGRRPLGFRGPGFSCPEEVLRILIARNYQYDASVFPTSIAPLARWFFLMKTDLRGEQLEKAKKLYGGFSSLRQPNRPFKRHLHDSSIWEMPVTVMPFARFPIHMSYVCYLASFSSVAAKTYFNAALSFCRWTKTSPSLLLHPPDFMGKEDDADLAHLPGIKMKRNEKLAFMRWALSRLATQFDVQCMIDQLKTLAPDVDPNLAIQCPDVPRPAFQATPCP
ncbi:MAG: polysaccharide deacetylase family protein [Planctomycetota bacterium]